VRFFRSAAPGPDARHAALPAERPPGQARPRLDDGIARGPRPPAQQRLRRLRDRPSAEYEAARFALEVPVEACAPRDPAGADPQQAEEGVWHSRRRVVPRTVEGTDAVRAVT